MTDRNSGPYDFDAALSFAREQRPFAERLARALQARGYRVFYDKDHRARLWGKQQAEFERIYGPRSRFVIPFVSKSYTEREWTLFEFDSARREARRREGEFILPVRVDDSRLLGLSDNVIYFDLSELSIRDIAAEFARKCGKPGKDRPTNPNRPRPTGLGVKDLEALLSQPVRKALGLIRAASLPLSLPEYKSLFPELDWPKLCAVLERTGLIDRVRGRVHAAQNCPHIFDDSENAEFSRLWIAALVPLRDHVDTALVLALNYLGVGQKADAVEVLADVAEGGDLGAWNEIYLVVLEALKEGQAATQLPWATRCRLSNSTGICMANAGRYREALNHFDRLRSQAHRKHDLSWVGQCWLNAGVAYTHLGDERTAIVSYRKAIELGKQTNDRLLVARAQGNLAGLLQRTAPDDAAQLLDASMKTKHKAGDEIGAVVAQAQIAQMKAVNGETQSALVVYNAAKRAARKLNRPNTLALIVYDIGSVHHNVGNPSKALAHYRSAYLIAARNGYVGVQLLALDGQGRACFELHRYGQAVAAFSKALELTADDAHQNERIGSLHAIGVLMACRGRMPEARRYMRRALRLTREAADPKWVVRCLSDSTRRLANGELAAFDLRKLKSVAEAEQKHAHWDYAGRLWQIYADSYARTSHRPAAVESAFASARKCFERLKDWNAVSDVLSRVYVYMWRIGKRKEALETLKRLEGVGRRAASKELVARALDQRGVCLQELGRYAEAARLHRRAVRASQLREDNSQIARSQNNLGEALRKSGNYAEAIVALKRAERLSISIDDREGLLAAMGNRTLALLGKGDQRGAMELMLRRRDRAALYKHWAEAATASAQLADLAWERGEIHSALSHYRRALAAAKNDEQSPVAARIALNYARLLMTQGQGATALRELRNHEDRFSGTADGYHFYYSMGELYQESGDLASAARYLKTGRQLAEDASDDDYIAMCGAKLAEVHEARKRYGDAGRELRVALSHEPDPEGRALLLIQLLRVQLASRESLIAEKTFHETVTLALEHNLPLVYIDIHVMLGNREWRGTRVSKLNALKAYTAAMLKSLEIDKALYQEIAGHVIVALTEPNYAPSQRQFVSLTSQLQDWLSGELASGGDHRPVTIPWPFGLVAELLPFIDDPKQLAAEVKRLCAAESPLR